jgi:hypothetical protein
VIVRWTVLRSTIRPRRFRWVGPSVSSRTGQIFWADLICLTAITRAVNRLLLVAVGRSDLDATGVNFALVVPTA